MNDVKLKPEMIDGKSIDIYVTENGEFFAKNPVDPTRDNIGGSTRAALIKKLRGMTRRSSVRIAIAATRWIEHGVWHSKKEELEDITLTGIHGSNGNLLIKRADGTTEQFSRYSASILKAMTPSEKREFLDMYRTMKHAAAAFETLLETYKVDGKELVRAAMKGAGVSDEDLDS